MSFPPSFTSLSRWSCFSCALLGTFFSLSKLCSSRHSLLSRLSAGSIERQKVAFVAPSLVSALLPAAGGLHSLFQTIGVLHGVGKNSTTRWIRNGCELMHNALIALEWGLMRSSVSCIQTGTGLRQGAKTLELEGRCC